MAAQIKKITIHGVTVSQINYQGKWYTPVAARVQIAEQADPDDIRADGRGYHVVSVQIIQMGEQWAYHCMVEYPIGSGVIRPGTDFIDMGDRKSGIAKAETSAIGRALGLHGIAIEEGIASAEEVRRAGTAFAPEMDEGEERPVDSPVERKPSAFVSAPKPLRPAAAAATPAEADDEPATADQQERMRKYRDALDITDKAIAVADNRLRYGAADARIHEYIARWQRERQLHPTATAQKEAK